MRSFCAAAFGKRWRGVIEKMPSQQQDDAHNCGVFVVINAVHWMRIGAVPEAYEVTALTRLALARAWLLGGSVSVESQLQTASTPLLRPARRRSEKRMTTCLLMPPMTATSSDLVRELRDAEATFSDAAKNGDKFAQLSLASARDKLRIRRTTFRARQEDSWTPQSCSSRRENYTMTLRAC
jgi:hypothetical protein